MASSMALPSDMLPSALLVQGNLTGPRRLSMHFRHPAYLAGRPGRPLSTLAIGRITLEAPMARFFALASPCPARTPPFGSAPAWAAQGDHSSRAAFATLGLPRSILAGASTSAW
jgi:hypothetical protein